jgi:hypothetical protein
MLFHKISFIYWVEKIKNSNSLTKFGLSTLNLKLNFKSKILESCHQKLQIQVYFNQKIKMYIWFSVANKFYLFMNQIKTTIVSVN